MEYLLAFWLLYVHEIKKKTPTQRDPVQQYCVQGDVEHFYICGSRIDLEGGTILILVGRNSLVILQTWLDVCCISSCTIQGWQFPAQPANPIRYDTKINGFQVEFSNPPTRQFRGSCSGQPADPFIFLIYFLIFFIYQFVFVLISNFKFLEISQNF